MTFTHDKRKTAYNEETYYSQGLRTFLLKVYHYMTGALGVTGIVAYTVASSDAMVAMIYQTPLYWLVVFAPLAFVFFFSSKIHSMSHNSAQIAFWSFAVLMGLSLSSIFLVYSGISIARVFFISASMFGAMALYGNVTKKDLSSMGSFMMMGLFGIIICSIFNIFMKSAALHFAVSFIGVIVFAGLTAYDMQKIKDQYYKMSDADALGKFAMMGAITLYFDFINLFLSMLHLFGDRK